MNEIVKYENGQITVEQDIVKQIRDFERIKAEMDLKEKHLKQSLKEAFEKYGITSWSTDGLSAKYKSSTTRTTIDSKRLKEELPDVYAEYSKTSDVASSISLTIS